MAKFTRMLDMTPIFYIALKKTGMKQDIITNLTKARMAT